MGNILDKYVLAMYDVRGKQEFIFKTNKIKEIIGGSAIIRDVFADYLYCAAESVSENNKGIYSYKKESGDTAFTQEGWEKHLSEGYVGEVIYDGGGNFFVIYKTKEILIEVNKKFTKAVLENIGTLRVLCSYVEIDNFDDYKADEKRLRTEHRRHENEESIMRSVNAIPFLQVDSNTSQPIVFTNIGKIKGKNIPPKVSQESYAKYKKFSNEQLIGEQILDKLVAQKGSDSMLAVIFIDGNNMGAKVSGCLENADSSDYKSSIAALREFSNDIQRKYVDETRDAIVKKLKNRIIVNAGDEMSFICKASDAFKAVEAYFDTLRKDESCSSCAGIALFHSHAPYYEVYKIAEECCDNAKTVMKKREETDTCYMDFQYCQGALGMNLDTMRARETGDLSSKPWLIAGESKEPDVYTLDEVKRIVVGLNAMDARTNIKDLVSSAKDSLQVFNMEMSRIYAHMSSTVKKNADVKYIFEDMIKDKSDNKKEERRRSLIYDIGIVYDQWFSKKGEQGEEVNDN